MSPSDHQRPGVTTLRDRKTLEREGHWFDEEAATRAVRFFAERLAHVKGRWAGDPFILEPWEAEEIVKPLFGWKRKDGTRLFRECYVRVARKNGKSTIAAGVAGLLTYADDEPGAEVYSAAVDRDQAGIVFGMLSNMVQSSPKLAARSQVYRRSIVVAKTNSSYKVLSADAPNKHGLNASGVIVDELHAHPSRDLFDVLSTSTGAREQPIVFSITTAGVYDPNGICVEKDEYTRKVATGQVKDPAFLGIIYELDEGDDWRDEASWVKANPSIDVTVPRDYLRRERDKAVSSPAAQNTFRMLHCNQWVQQSVRWIDLGLWDEQASIVDENELKGRTCYGGLDIGAVSDLTAWVMLFPNEPGQCKHKGHEEGGCVQIVPRFWVPRGAMEKGKENAALYQQWERDGLIRVTESMATDYTFVDDDIEADASKFYVQEAMADFKFQGHSAVSPLVDAGLPIRAFGRGAWPMPMKEFERRLVEGMLHHGGNPVLRWMADNVVAKMDSDGNLKPDRQKSRNKIDGIVAIVMALEPLVIGETPAPMVAYFDV